MNSQTLKEVLGMGRETRGIEFKESTPWENKKFKLKIIKAILALSNIRDGGFIIVGVKDTKGNGFLDEGMKAEDLQSWNTDEVLRFANEYADPYVNLSLERVSLDGKVFLVIAVDEFHGAPTICKKDGDDVLRNGTIYTRTNRLAESSAVPSQSEMREILNIAIEKSMREFLGIVTRSGATISRKPSDEDLFDQELEDFK